MNRISKNSINYNFSMIQVQKYLCLTPAQSRAYKAACDTAAGLALTFVEETHRVSYGDAVNIFIGMLTVSRGIPQWYADAYRRVAFWNDEFQYPSWERVLLAGLRLSKFDDYEF